MEKNVESKSAIQTSNPTNTWQPSFIFASNATPNWRPMSELTRRRFAVVFIENIKQIG